MGVDSNRRPGERGAALGIALVGSLLAWAALPPLSIGWLAWVAPVPWLLLVQAEKLPGKHPFLAVYGAGLAFWLATIHWLRLPHPLVYAGWFALSAYLAVYLPLFVGLSRVAVHRLGLPLWLAGPTVWTGLELARAHIMTGFLMGSLAHTQIAFPRVIQIADLLGEYGVDFLIVLVAAGIARVISDMVFEQSGESLPSPSRGMNAKWAWKSLLPAALALAAVLAYGHRRLDDFTTSGGERTVRIALIQGNSLADWKFDDEKQRQIMDEYVRLSQEAVAKAGAAGDGRPVDLVVWPETMFRVPWIAFEDGFQLPTYASSTKAELAAMAPEQLSRLVAALGNTPVLVGIDRWTYEASRGDAASTNAEVQSGGQPQSLRPTKAYNSAVLVNRVGEIVGRYDKSHLVMFGEYVPFSRWLPFLRRISSLTGSVDAGKGPAVLTLETVSYSPSICYETVIPHVIRRQARARDAAGNRPDVLVNMTNDAWYWGSSELDQHLACGVFRAIETRRPLVIAANGGISAWIDAQGRVRAKGPKMRSDVILADVAFDRAGETTYVRFGDWFAVLCLACCVGLAMIGWKQRFDSPKTGSPGDKVTRRD